MPMRLIEDLRAEHVLIEAAVGSLGTFVDRFVRGEGNAADGQGFLRFFRLFAGAYHHAREEDTLFRALVQGAGLPEDRGPVAALTRQHREMAAVLDRLGGFLVSGEDLPDGWREDVTDLARRYAHALLAHIDAENSVLLPESEARLVREHVPGLVGRPPTPEELSAREEGERLVRAYPPTVDAAAIRGEGCVICPSYGTTCDGVEREWWNEWEWEELPNRLG